MRDFVSLNLAARRTDFDHPDWPHRSLDVDQLRRAGCEPVPFHEFVLKVHQRCNLSCDYCFVYESPDQSWRDRPNIMSAAVCAAAVERIAEHVRRHGLLRVSVVLHGGEPLLAGVDRLVDLTTELRASIPAEVTVGIQTNGIALNEEALLQLSEAEVRIGVSIDGLWETHDQHRRGRNGSGSHAAVERALNLLASSRFRSSYQGLLSIVDTDAPPVETYEALLRYSPPAIDLLLPHANWESPPRREPGHATPHADWLIAIFDRWYSAPRRETSVRLFEEIISLLFGQGSRSEQVGASPVALVVIETDGDIELVDSLKSAYPGACSTALNVREHELDAALDHPGVVARQIGVEALSDACRACPVGRVCGGGHYVHRYRAGEGFRHPSVYCADMLSLIGHIGGRLSADLAALPKGGI
ncbi:FxsB family cyclophane-forming radical SAM/SPASM peptide maturase [Actinoplanes palleronii]|uniref:Radical SAM core domain-containing protein n=1 Tax=Actinoplanes palleronii TaxID=113570 RepID=A0ABQ4BHD6_9ACTN|nr:FxsB family cyclophane-forming radical SAM/SPASM peptide maturase [Actinoplanes palleronii]GIE70099.1 hypothetical protein Apa02nite_062070 [Actinoplanes palleronii]